MEHVRFVRAILRCNDVRTRSRILLCANEQQVWDHSWRKSAHTQEDREARNKDPPHVLIALIIWPATGKQRVYNVHRDGAAQTW